MGDFPSGQRGQTVNLLSTTSLVRIQHPPPQTTQCESIGFFVCGGGCVFRPGFFALQRNLVRKFDERCLGAGSQAPRRNSFPRGKPPASPKKVLKVAFGCFFVLWDTSLDQVSLPCKGTWFASPTKGVCELAHKRLVETLSQRESLQHPYFGFFVCGGGCVFGIGFFAGRRGHRHKAML